ncbi:group II intron maturase-specific domain-containing protein [Streptomyces sp. NPDC056656]|uniref:group II intron maturase-specific domain-containing protein n=1 Tax=Streptomyces sp. NPDC056656 TaxID=3345895 RepID=UPI003682C0CD
MRSTPQGGILSPLLANIALSVLDEHLHPAWERGGELSTDYRRGRRRAIGLPSWRLVRYADDFVVLVDGTRQDTEALHEEIAQMIAPIALRLSPAKTQVVHLSEGFDFLGFHIQWHRKRGTNKWYVYTFIADRPLRSVKAKIRRLTHRTSQQDLAVVLINLDRITLGWADYFRHAVAKRIFSKLDDLVWRRLVRLLRTRHHWSWSDSADGSPPSPGGGRRSARSRSPGIATAATRSPPPGPLRPPDGRDRGEHVA